MLVDLYYPIVISISQPPTTTDRRRSKKCGPSSHSIFYVAVCSKDILIQHKHMHSYLMFVCECYSCYSEKDTQKAPSKRRTNSCSSFCCWAMSRFLFSIGFSQ